MQDTHIRTRRLLLRRWRAEDIEPFAAMCGDPEVMRYIGSGTTRTREQAAAEAAAAVLDFALAHLRLAEVVSIHQVDNRTSARIVRKLGMRFDRQTVDPTCGRLIEIHRASG